ncbi:MAG: hypothetical protein P1U68_07980 [Verrucomicrobiales bacterium]|nr:hypothetical protein [Verrucomicrobiales bacterium]
MNVSYAISGALFLLVALLSFSVWALGGRWFPNEPAMYAGCAIIFLGLGGAALLPSKGRSGSRALSFCLSFAVSYTAYAFLWSVAWFTLPNTFGEILGSSFGLLAFAAILIRWNRLRIPLLVATSVLFFFHTFGYYLGGFTYLSLQGKGPLAVDMNLPQEQVRLLARLSWGAGYGLGLGSGLVTLFYLSRQSSERPSTHI